MMKNTHVSFGPISKALHWGGAILIFAMIGLGIAAVEYPLNTPEEMAAKWELFALHKTVGVCAFGFGALRLISMAAQVRPLPLSGHAAFEVFLAHTVRWLLTFLMMLVPLAGWVRHASLPGFAPLYLPFGDSLPFVPADPQLSQYASALHFGLIALLVISVVMHVAGALKHHFWDRDETLRRMLPSARVDSEVQEAPRKMPPLMAAIAIILVVALAVLANAPQL